jgi:hypothetical protein
MAKDPHEFWDQLDVQREDWRYVYRLILPGQIFKHFCAEWQELSRADQTELIDGVKREMDIS